MKKKTGTSWEKIIEKLNDSKSGKLKVEMGSPGSAQVTRCRLLREYDALKVRTEGPSIILEVAS